MQIATLMPECRRTLLTAAASQASGQSDGIAAILEAAHGQAYLNDPEVGDSYAVLYYKAVYCRCITVSHGKLLLSTLQKCKLCSHQATLLAQVAKCHSASLDRSNCQTAAPHVRTCIKLQCAGSHAMTFAYLLACSRTLKGHQSHNQHVHAVRRSCSRLWWWWQIASRCPPPLPTSCRHPTRRPAAGS